MRLNRFLSHIAILISICHLSFAQLASAWWKANQLSVGRACKTAVTNAAIYCKGDNTVEYDCQCADVVAMGAYAFCGYTETEGHPASRKRFEDYFISFCPNYTHQMIADSYANVTNYIKNSTEISGFNRTIPSRVPVLYSKARYTIVYKSVYQRFLNNDYGIIFGSALVGYWAAIFAVFAIYRCLEMMNLSDKLVNNNRVFRFFQANIFLKPVFGKKHKSDYIFGCVPVTADAIIIIGFIILDVVACFVNIHFLPNSTIWPVKATQIGRLIGDRSGYIAVFTTNLTWLFAGRNNFILWCTGWNFQSFLTYHKWVARMTVFNVLVHSIAYLINGKSMGLVAIREAQDWYRWGCVATVAGSVMLLQSMYPLRKHAYEVFLYFHIVLAVFFLVGTWIHLVWYEFQYYVYASVGLWCFDRLLRVVRIAAFGGFRKNNVKIVNNEFLILSIKNYNKKFFKPQPGNFVFIYFGLKNCFWQSHAFTILSASEEELKVIATVKKGCTKTVFSHMVAAKKTTMDMPIAFEGPYGSTREKIINHDQNILMYSTNTGVAGPYNYLKTFAKKGALLNKNVKFYWTVRHWTTLELLAEELQFLSEQNNIEVIVHVTQYDDAPPSSCEQSLSDEGKQTSAVEKVTSCQSSSFSADSIQKLYPNIKFRPGRLPVKDTVTRDISECLDNTNITIMLCGHPSFCDELRSIAIENIKKEKTKNIHLIDDLQVW